MKIWVFLVLLVVICHSSAEVVHFSVGTGSCDYSTPQQAIDAINTESVTNTQPTGSGANSFHLHLVAETFTGGVLVVDLADFEITGGYADCTAAETFDRENDSFSVLDGDGSTTMALLNNSVDMIDMTITGLHITNGTHAGFFPSGGITIAGKVDALIRESRVYENTGLWGGGIYAGVDSKLRLEKTMVIDNEATLGGGIFCTDCQMVIDVGSGISHNTASEDGGGLYFEEGALVSFYSGSTTPQLNDFGIHNNTAFQHGGGVYLNQSFANFYGYAFNGNGDFINPVNITKNTAQQGGGIYAVTSSINTSLIDFSQNMASQSGAGFSLHTNSVLKIDNKDALDVPVANCWNNNISKCNLIQNNIIQNGGIIGDQGGAIDAIDSAIHIEHTWFEANDAGGDGNGAVIAMLSANPGSNIDHSVFHNNGFATGSDNSLIYLDVFSELAVRHNTWADNDIQQAMVHLVDAGSSFEFFNSVVSNLNGDTVFDKHPMATVTADCMLTSEDTSFPAPPASNNVWQGDPMFYDRAGDDFRQLGQSVTTIDRCAHIVGLDSIDMALQNRQYDVENLSNDDFDFVDTGAYEYQGVHPDVIFADGFQ